MEEREIFTTHILRDGEWFVAFSPEFPEGNGQGLTQEEALESLRESILLLLEDRREDVRANTLFASTINGVSAFAGLALAHTMLKLSITTRIQ